MQYYKIPNIIDGCQVYSRKTQKYISFVGGELYTLRELEQMGVAWLAKKLEAVEVSRKKIYWFFGARFATEGAGKEAAA
jgi:hypothetical protein